MIVTGKEVSLLAVVHELEAESRASIGIGQDLVTRQVDMTLDLVLLRTLHVVEMSSLEDKVSRLPGVVPLSLLLDVATKVGFTDLCDC